MATPLIQPTNTFTVSVADTHSHNVSQSGIPASSKLDAVAAVIPTLMDAARMVGSPANALVLTDTLTITITQP